MACIEGGVDERRENPPQAAPNPSWGAGNVALEAILRLRSIWCSYHRGHEWMLDAWGEGPSRVRLVDLGLDPALRSWKLSAVCPFHGTFGAEWSGRRNDVPPEYVRCTTMTAGDRCAQSCAVRLRWQVAA